MRFLPPPACHGTCCDLEAVEEFWPFCSHECRALARMVSWQGIQAPKHVSGQYVPPPVAPWSWLDARATSDH